MGFNRLKVRLPTDPEASHERFATCRRLLVNEMTGKIVEIIPETQPETTGQK